VFLTIIFYPPRGFHPYSSYSSYSYTSSYTSYTYTSSYTSYTYTSYTYYIYYPQYLRRPTTTNPLYLPPLLPPLPPLPGWGSRAPARQFHSASTEA